MLTAAHCTSGDFRLDIVRLGAHNLALDNEVSHEDDDDDDYDDDDDDVVDDDNDGDDGDAGRCRGLPGEEGGDPPPVQSEPDTSQRHRHSGAGHPE